MGFRYEPLDQFTPIHEDLQYKNDSGYTIRFSQDDVGKLFTAKYQYSAAHDPDVGDRYKRFDGLIIGKLYGACRVDVMTCATDKDLQAVKDPSVDSPDLRRVGSWSLPAGADPSHVTQPFNALALGTADGKRFLLVIGIRVAACESSGRVKTQET